MRNKFLSCNLKERRLLKGEGDWIFYPFRGRGYYVPLPFRLKQAHALLLNDLLCELLRELLTSTRIDNPI